MRRSLALLLALGSWLWIAPAGIAAPCGAADSPSNHSSQSDPSDRDDACADIQSELRRSTMCQSPVAPHAERRNAIVVSVGAGTLFGGGQRATASPVVAFSYARNVTARVGVEASLTSIRLGDHLGFGQAQIAALVYATPAFAINRIVPFVSASAHRPAIFSNSRAIRWRASEAEPNMRSSRCRNRFRLSVRPARHGDYDSRRMRTSCAPARRAWDRASTS
jgi:hypothetical protein